MQSFFNVKADGANCYQGALGGEIISVSHRNPFIYYTTHTLCLIKRRLDFVSRNCPATIFKFMLCRSPPLITLCGVVCEFTAVVSIASSRHLSNPLHVDSI